jgi:hypothetical protein
MNEGEVFETAKDRLRRQLTKILEDCNNSIADLEFGIECRPDLAWDLAADAHISLYLDRQWAKKALADLDADEPIPSPPS